MIPLGRLKEGVRFVQPDLGIRGTVVKTNDCRVHVRIDAEKAQTVEFESRGKRVKFTRIVERVADWAPGTPVLVEL